MAIEELTSTCRSSSRAQRPRRERRRGSSARCRESASRFFDGTTPSTGPAERPFAPWLLADRHATTYGPSLGARFLTRDPLEAITRSPYAYVSGNPLNMVDPLGLFCIAGKNPNGSCRGSGAVKTVTKAVKTGAQVVEVGALVVAGGAALIPGGQVVAGAALIVAETAGVANTALTCFEYLALEGSRSECLTSIAVDVGTAGVGRVVTPGVVKKGERIYSAAERGIQAGVDLTGELIEWAVGYDHNGDYRMGQVDCEPVPRFEARP